MGLVCPGASKDRTHFSCGSSSAVAYCVPWSDLRALGLVAGMVRTVKSPKTRRIVNLTIQSQKSIARARRDSCGMYLIRGDLRRHLISRLWEEAVQRKMVRRLYARVELSAVNDVPAGMRGMYKISLTTGERTLSVAFVLLCRSRYRRVTIPALTYCARLR